MKLPLVSIIVKLSDSGAEFCEKLVQMTEQIALTELLVVPNNKSQERQYTKLNSKVTTCKFWQEDKFNATKLIDYIANRCSGKYVLLLSDKDEFDVQFLQKMVGRAEASSADIVFCDFKRFNDVKLQDEEVGWSLKQNYLPSKLIFNASDCSSKIFNIAPMGVFNKLYRREFLKSVRYEISEDTDGFLAFALETFVSADRISYLRDKLFSWHSKTKKELKNIEKGKAIVKEFGDVYYFLMQAEKEKLFHKSFVNYFVQKIYLIDLALKEPFKSFWESFITFQLSHYFDVDDKSEDYFYEPYIYQWIMKLKLKQNMSSALEKMYQTDKKSIIPIVMAINNDYMCMAGVTIQSIKEHASKDKFYDIYIMYTWLEPESIRKLEALSCDLFRVSCVNVHPYLIGYSFEDKMNKRLWHISKETFYRFLIADVLEGYDKIIYLDADLIVRSDLADLHKITLGKDLLGGCRNPAWPEEYDRLERVLKIDWSSYINAGVLLLNAKLWRDEGIGDKCFQTLYSYENALEYQDQDILNIVCQNRIRLIDCHWNFIYSLWVCINHDYIRYLKDNSFDVADIKILHYTWWKKPWAYPEDEMTDIWWDYAKRSPFYEAILLKRIRSIKQEKSNNPEASKNLTVKNISSENMIKTLQKSNPNIYPLLSQYIKESVLFMITWGKKRRYHAQNMDILKEAIEKGIK